MNKQILSLTDSIGRRSFIGGSDARIIMGIDETALIRLWQEKRGEAEPEDLSDSLIVQLGAATEELNRSWYERNTGRRVIDVQHRVRHSAIPWMVEGTGAVFEAKFMLPWSFSEEAAAEKYMGQLQHNMWVTHFKGLGALDHYRRRQVGRDHNPHGSALSQRSGLGGKEILALRPIRRNTSPDQFAHRGRPHRRYERVQFLGGVRRAVPQHPERISRPRTGDERAQSLDARGCQGGHRARREGQALEIGGGEL